MPNHVSLHWIDVGVLASGAPLRLPIHTIDGGAGPTAAVVATVHGDEPIAIEVVRRVIGELTEADLAGTVLALPVLNPIAFESYTRNTWIDMTNLNRSFPGRPNGSLSEQLARVITEEVLNNVDALIDLHTGSPAFIVDYSYAFDDGEFARTFGSNVTIKRPPIPGTSAEVVHKRGKPIVISEFGGGAFRDEFYIEKGIAGTLNCLKALDMLPGTPAVPADQPTTDKMTLFRPRNGGLLVPAVTGDDLGTVVPEGTLLGQLRSPYTFEILEEFVAPYTRNLVTLVGAGPVRMHPGDFAYMVVDPDVE